MESIVNKFNNVINYATSSLIEREDVIMTIFRTIISGNNCVFIGSPGIAKSLAVRTVTRMISKCNYFEKLIKRDTTTDELFGLMSIAKMKEDIFERNTKNTMVDAHIAFLDEIFEGNSGCLNGTNAIMNERIFDNGGTIVKSPLISLFAASNKFPENEEIEAFKDRFIACVIVDRIQSDDNFESLLNKIIDNKFTDTAIPESITLDEIKIAQREAMAIPFDGTCVRELRKIRNELAAANIYPTDRKFAKVIGYLRADAWIKNQEKVTSDNFECLIDCLWKKQKDIPVVSDILKKYINPIAAELDSIEAVYHAIALSQEYIGIVNMTVDKSVIIATYTKIAPCAERLKVIAATYPKMKPRVEEIRAKIKSLSTAMLKIRDSIADL